LTDNRDMSAPRARIRKNTDDEAAVENLCRADNEEQDWE